MIKEREDALKVKQINEQKLLEEEKRIEAEIYKHEAFELAKVEKDKLEKKEFEKVWAMKRKQQMLDNEEERRREREEGRVELERLTEVLESEIEKEKKLQRVGYYCFKK